MGTWSGCTRLDGTTVDLSSVSADAPGLNAAERRFYVGPHVLALATDSIGRVWVYQEDTTRPWIAEMTGIASVFRTDPSSGIPHWALGGLVGGSGGLPSTVTDLVVTVEDREVARCAVAAPGWLVGLPPHAGHWRPTLTFRAPDGATYGSRLSFPGELVAALGSHPDESPDGTGWTTFAPLPSR